MQTLPHAGLPELAVFDMDGTLTRGDTFLPWLDAVAGWRRVRGAFARAVPAAFGAVLRGEDGRSALKDAAARRVLQDVPVAAARAAAERIAPGVAWRPEMVAALAAHRAAGRRILVATATPVLAARILLEPRFGPVEILGSQLEERGGVLTGRLVGGNCARALKAERVAAWMIENGPFGESWGYGNRPHDVAMLALMDHRQIV